MSKSGRLKKFSYKGGKKTTIPLYPRNYVNEERSHKNKKIGLEPRLACVKEMTHDMFNMPMNESCLVWPLKQLLCFQKLIKLKAIKHKYHVWKDYLQRNNEWITKWNARAREVREQEICNRIVVAK
jgi:hypothetical protein